MSNAELSRQDETSDCSQRRNQDRRTQQRSRGNFKSQLWRDKDGSRGAWEIFFTNSLSQHQLLFCLSVCLIWRDRGRVDSSSYYSGAILCSLQIKVYLTHMYELLKSPQIQISNERERQTQFPLSEGSAGRRSGSRVSH